MWPISLTVLLAWTANNPAPTFNKDIAPLLWKHCADCHRTGEIGPFPLLSYKDAAKRASFLVDVVQSRQMPPWKAEPGYGKFRDEHRLSEAEIQLVAAWAKAGAPEGAAADLPKPPEFPSGWRLGEPDVVLQMAQPFKVPANGRDLQQCFVIPIPVDGDRTVMAFDFRPGNSKVVHHAILYLDEMGIAKRKDKGNGYNSFGGPGILPSGALGAWAPGTTPTPLPDGFGRYMKKGSDLVLQIHYHPSGKEEIDQSKIGLYFTKKPAKQIVGGIGVSARKIDIPPGEKNYRIHAESAPLPVDAKVLEVFPHMHYVGKEMKAYIVHTDGKQEPLIWIRDWDFNWQGGYILKEPVKLPKGSHVKIESVYDNSSDNPRNPSSPPKRVLFGEQTTNEMCLFGMAVVTENPQDLRQIARMKGNFSGRLFGGAIPGNTGDEEYLPIPDVLPDAVKQVLDGYDKNKDGFLDTAEIDAMPAFIRDKLREQLGKRKKP
jgi:hypothetical protein